MGPRKRVFPALVSCLLASAIALASCGKSEGTSHSPGQSNESAAHPRAIATPAGVIAGTMPQPNGVLWVLAGTRRVRTINEIDLLTERQTAAVGVSDTARALAQSSTGSLAVGLGSARAGAVELRTSTGAIADTILVGAPVMSLAFGDDGMTLYALNGTGKTRSVTVIDTATRKVTETVGLPSDARSIAPTPDQHAIWSLQASGVLQETSLSSRRPIESFPTGSPGIALATSPNGDVLYALKGTPGTANIAVISAATEQIRRVLPAAANSVGLGVSLDGAQLYDFVGSSSHGNIQILNN